ncbi:MFS transporter [Actinoplanes sp. N902-109]|uniref:MFS transporter n=1 Tax=Actinoplanes sp. (strain N902-109) TaxID=649831 RepID=UPI000329475D|nr:MFS transporter [Actinoplanes sp. N902-109]AGL15463.1 major facilitator superfamily protein [Actinoplanes sp. N902-109]
MQTQRNAALFVAISVLAGFGSSAMALVSGIWILDLTGSAARAALAGLAVYLPPLVGPWLGALVDRVPRRPLLIGTNLLLTAALLSLLTVHDAGDAWLLYAVSLVYGLSYVLLDAGESAVLPAALPPEQLGDVNGWRSSAQEGMKLIAPLAGAALYAWRGGPAVVLISAVLPLLSAVLYALLRLRPVAAAPATTTRGRLFGTPVVRATVGIAAVAIGMSGFVTAAQFAVVTDDLGLPSTFLGVLASAQGAGSIVAGLGAGRLIARRGVMAVAATGAVLYAIGLLARCLPWWPALVAGAVAGGAGLPWTLIAAMTAVQTHTPQHLLGRASATAAGVMFGPIVLANPLGALTVHLGARVTFGIAALACLAAPYLLKATTSAGSSVTQAR